MSINNANERLIQFLKNEVNNQQDLFNKYYTLNAEISRKIKSISDVLPDMESNIKEKSESLKSCTFYLIV